jgi:hypothetical protein
LPPFPGLATSPSSGYRRLVGSLFEIEDLGRDVLDTPSAAAANTRAKILAVLPQEGQIAATLPMAIPGPKASGFPDNKVPLNTLRLAIERLGGWRSATSMLKGVRLGASFGLFNSASWTAHGS